MPGKSYGGFSVPDMVSLGSAAVVGLYVLFQQGADIRSNAQDIKYVKQEVVEVKETHERDKDDTTEAIKEQERKTQDKFDRVDKKLDTVIQHLIERSD